MLHFAAAVAILALLLTLIASPIDVLKIFYPSYMSSWDQILLPSVEYVIVKVNNGPSTAPDSGYLT